MNVQYVSIEDIRPYEKNPRKNDDSVEYVANSIREFGWRQPIVVDADGVIIAGHTRYKAAKKLNMKKVPVLVADDLTDEQVKAYRLADNKTGEMAKWDFPLLNDELFDLCDVDMDAFGFTDHEAEEFTQKMGRQEEQETTDEYNEFVEKFKPKKTTDDCYTPPEVYDAVKDWTVKEYKLKGNKIIRPFYPGGDYQSEEYPKGCVVIDNPPFSILSEICKWYAEKGIQFFLFAPTLTLFSVASGTMNYVVADCDIVYENGAIVNTSFVTNMGTTKIHVAGSLKNAVDKAKVKEDKNKNVYDYPQEVVTSARLAKLAGAGVEWQVKERECAFIRAMDAQKKEGKVLYGGGFLLSENAAAKRDAAEKAAAEKAAAEKEAAEKAAEKEVKTWELSERERDIVRGLC